MRTISCEVKEDTRYEILPHLNCVNMTKYYIRKIFGYLVKIPQDIVQAPRNELVTAAACQFIANSLTMSEIFLEQKGSASHWRKFIDIGLRHRSSSVQEAAAEAMAAVSRLVDCSSMVKR